MFRRTPLLVALAIVPLVAYLGSLIPAKKICPDFVCYWAAGKILLKGGNPYDPALQTAIQRQVGWDRDRDGLGLYEFLPFYYPPWFAMLCVPFVFLKFSAAKLAWLVANAELLMAATLLLARAAGGVPRRVTMIVVPLFIFSWGSVVIGQTTLLTLVLIAVSWRSLETGRDGLAGAALAYLSFKPQLSAFLLLGLLVWSARRRRWGVIVGFGVAMLVMIGLSSLILPAWPGEFLNATRVTPPPTEHFPAIGTTWYLLLKVLGLRGPVFWLAYLAIAAPFLTILARSAIDRSRPLGEVLSLGILAAYVLAPYGRHYDFPVLLIPLLVLIDGRASAKIGTAILMTLLVVPYLQYALLPTIKARLGMTGPFSPEFTFFWVPALLTVAWSIASTASRPRVVSEV